MPTICPPYLRLNVESPWPGPRLCQHSPAAGLSGDVDTISMGGVTVTWVWVLYCISPR